MHAEEDDLVSDDTEITLGVGKILMLFFGLVILCGIALGVGYTLGRNSMKQTMANAAVTPVAAAPVAVPVASPKPGAAQAAPVETPHTEEAAPQPAPAEAPSSTKDLAFSRSLSQKDDHPKLAPKPAPPAPAPAAPAPHATLGAGYMVQVAAVRNQDDAKLLSETLQRQHFPVVIVQPGDKLYHVQVGPYADVKDAETIRGKLIGAGYNAFLKR